MSKHESQEHEPDWLLRTAAGEAIVVFGSDQSCFGSTPTGRPAALR